MIIIIIDETYNVGDSSFDAGQLVTHEVNLNCIS